MHQNIQLSDRIPNDNALKLFVDLNGTDKCDFSGFYKIKLYILFCVYDDYYYYCRTLSQLARQTALDGK